MPGAHTYYPSRGRSGYIEERAFYPSLSINYTQNTFLEASTIKKGCYSRNIPFIFMQS
jgi:hypothetical protein